MYMYMDTQTLIQIHVCTHALFTCTLCTCTCMYMRTFVPFFWYLRCMRPDTGTVSGVQELL